MIKFLTILKKVIYYPLVVLVCFEISLWIIGYRPYANHNYKVRAHPKNAFVGDPDLGIRANPGRYSITLNDKVKFVTTHSDQGYRKIPRSTTSSPNGKVAFLGCSLTYGYGVNDDETFVALLQKQHPDWVFENYGIPGYGTVQSYLQLKEMLLKDKPQMVVLCFSNFHFSRNVMSQDYRSNLKIGYRNSSTDVDTRMAQANFPFVRDETLVVRKENWKSLYTNFPLRGTLATANWLQNNIDKFKDRNLNLVQVTEALIGEMAKICIENQILFRALCIDNSPEIQELQRRRGREFWLNVHFNFKKKKYTNLPYDSHPNAAGHQLIAQRISPNLTRILNGCE